MNLMTETAAPAGGLLLTLGYPPDPGMREIRGCIRDLDLDGVLAWLDRTFEPNGDAIDCSIWDGNLILAVVRDRGSKRTVLRLDREG